jgi:hypothetical protein
MSHFEAQTMPSFVAREEKNLSPLKNFVESQ